MSDVAVIATENGWRRRLERVGELDYETAYPFLKWLVEDSHMAPYILTDLSFGWEYGFVVSSHLPTHFLQTILIATRHFYECHAQAFVKFNELLSKDVPPMVAYVLCFGSCYSRVGFSLNHPVAFKNTHRSAIDGGLAGYKEYASCTPQKRCLGITGDVISLGDTSRYYTNNNSSYFGGIKIFCDIGNTVSDLLADKTFREKLSSYRKKTVSSETYQPPNPFSLNRVSQINEYQISFEELFEVGVPFIMDYIKTVSSETRNSEGNEDE